jgi:hypothetical protein
VEWGRWPGSSTSWAVTLAHGEEGRGLATGWQPRPWFGEWEELSLDTVPIFPLHQAVAQNMDSVFKELLGKTAVRQGLGPTATDSPSSGTRSRLGRNKGFSRGPGAPVSPSTSHPQGPDLALKPH